MMQDNTRSCCPSGRAWAVCLLRLALGMCFLFYGLHKFGIGDPKADKGVVAAYRSTVAGLTGLFHDTWLAGFPSSSFSHAIPFLEVGLGGLLILGFRTRAALVLTGATLIGLTFGMVVMHNLDTVAKNLVYLLLDGVALALVDDGNAFSLDACRACKRSGL